MILVKEIRSVSGLREKETGLKSSFSKPLPEVLDKYGSQVPIRCGTVNNPLVNRTISLFWKFVLIRKNLRAFAVIFSIRGFFISPPFPTSSENFCRNRPPRTAWGKAASAAEKLSLNSVEYVYPSLIILRYGIAGRIKT